MRRRQIVRLPRPPHAEQTMPRRGRLIAAAEAPVDALGEDYFVGVRGLGAADEYFERDAMSFCRSGARAIANGGGDAQVVWLLR